jgi:hypothetical protein
MTPGKAVPEYSFNGIVTLLCSQIDVATVPPHLRPRITSTG